VILRRYHGHSQKSVFFFKSVFFLKKTLTFENVRGIVLRTFSQKLKTHYNLGGWGNTSAVGARGGRVGVEGGGACMVVVLSRARARQGGRSASFCVGICLSLSVSALHGATLTYLYLTFVCWRVLWVLFFYSVNVLGRELLRILVFASILPCSGLWVELGCSLCLASGRAGVSTMEQRR
jgi:hypothetical protein